MNYDALSKYAINIGRNRFEYDFKSSRKDYAEYCAKGVVANHKLQKGLDELTSNHLILDVASTDVNPWDDNNNSCRSTERLYMKILNMKPNIFPKDHRGIILSSDGEPYAMLKCSGTQNLLALQTVKNTFGDISLIKGGIYKVQIPFIYRMDEKHLFNLGENEWKMEDMSQHSMSIHFDRFILPQWIENAYIIGARKNLPKFFAKVDKEVARVKRELLHELVVS